MHLTGEEFLRRFCQHILPWGFVRIRHYGILASRVKTEKLLVARNDLNTEAPPKPALDWKSIATQRLNYDPDLCPYCKQGQMITLLYFDGANGPPDQQLLRIIQQNFKQNVNAA